MFPPQIIIKPGSSDYDKGISYKFNTTYKIPNDKIIELLEIEFRRNNNDQLLNNKLKGLYNKFENLVLIQNEIFNRYMNEKKKKLKIMKI